MTLRQERLGSEIAKSISASIRKLNDPRIKGMISVTNAEVTRDFGFCDVSISVMGADEAEVLKGIESSKGFIRNNLFKVIGNVHTVPELRFKIDNAQKHHNRIDELLRQIKKDENKD